MFINPHRVSTPHASTMVDTGDVSLHVTRFDGNGPEVLLIHGIGSSSATWVPVIDRLAVFTSPITIDLRGHGLSDKPERGYVYENYTRDIDALIQALGLDNPIIIGHSLGGVMTLAWAMHHPTIARAMVIEDAPVVSSFRFRPAFDWWIILNSLPYELVKAFYAREHPDWPERTVQNRARIMKVAKRAVFTEMREITFIPTHLNYNGSMTDITADVLYVHGDPDNGSLVPNDHVADLPNHLPHVEIHKIPGGKHAMHRSHPEEFVDAVLRFFEKHGIIPQKESIS